MKNNELCEVDCVIAAAAIRDNAISSREATQASLDRLNAVNRTINAVAKPLNDGALAQADAADAARAAFFDQYPVVATPTMCAPAFPLDHDTRDPETMKTIMAAFAPLPAIARLALLAISVPVGFAQGTPVGSQLVTRWHEDACCLAAAEVIEHRVGPMIPIDPIAK